MPLRSITLLVAGLLCACTYRQPYQPPPPPPGEDPDGGSDGGVTVIPPEPPLPWSRRSVTYEVFVRSFKDSSGDGNGDLNGLTSKLDYLADLGVDAIWLMPIFPSPSYHGYDITDYDGVNPDYGTAADFQRLAAEAHRRGIKIVLDLVINHTGSGHPWFADSASSSASAHRDWYVWSATDPGWKTPWDPYTGAYTWHLMNGAYYYAVFWGGMPDLNFRTQGVRDEMKRVAAQWLGWGADGFRLDAARYLVETGGGGGQSDTLETHAYWREFATAVKAVRPDAMLVGESWTDTTTISTYYNELPLNFDFPLSDALIAGINNGTGAGIASVIDTVRSVYPSGATDAPFLRNHDMTRTGTMLGASTGRIASALAVLLTVPGSPFLYYGEELGLRNGDACGNCDEDKRSPMPWDATSGGGFTTGTPWHPFAPGQSTANVAAQAGSSASLLARTRKLIAVHHGSEALSQGSIKLYSRSGQVLAFTRTSGPETVLVIHNLGDSGATAGPYALSAAGATTLFADPGVTDLSGSSGSFHASLAGRGTGIYRMQ
ncbi:MAG TPA: alpha-amylase family glycosyl hydrolase [Myxococcales bacterium]|nr:alpha-amylase family glycosyl hydrolase [Myxococcales bacterium]